MNPREYLHCPTCHGPERLTDKHDSIECTNPDCGVSFPIIEGVPILISEQKSVFSIDQIGAAMSRGRAKPTGLRQLSGFFPSITANPNSSRNYSQFFDRLKFRDMRPRVLVVGGGVAGQGLDAFLSNEAIDFVETDVYFGPRVAVICDAHDLPFDDSYFDGVIAQAVLEHVIYPQRCVDEIYRVLRSDGLVYAETPFMQQVHGGRYDFTRFTFLGHRHLFRMFEEVDSGLATGPGTAMAWAYQYLLLSFAHKRVTRALIRGFARLTGFWLKYLDYLVANRPAALDAAAGLFFVGKKSPQALSDRELITLYRGGSITS